MQRGGVSVFTVCGRGRLHDSSKDVVMVVGLVGLCVGEWVLGSMDGWMDGGWIDAWMDGRMDAWAACRREQVARTRGTSCIV